MKIQKTYAPPLAFQAGAVVSTLLLADNTTFGAMTTVGTLTSAPPAVGIVDLPVNVGNANFVTLITMSNAVSRAFANNALAGLGGLALLSAIRRCK